MRWLTPLCASMLLSCLEPSQDDDLAEEVASQAYDEEAETQHHAEEWARMYADPDKASNVALVPPDPAPKNVIALTFDDGPKVGTTDRVVEVLRQQNVPATFFMNGIPIKRSAASRALAQTIADDPLFMVANHSYSHQNMKAMPSAERAKEIGRVTDLIVELGNTPRYFRFPYGSASAAGITQATGIGYAVTGWHVDSGDWCFQAGGGRCKASTWDGVPDQYRDNMKGYVLSQLTNQRGGIVLFHDIHRYTADALEDIIIALKARGYTFVRLDDTAFFPKLNAMATPSVPARFIGDFCAYDADCNYTDGACVLGICTKLCEGTCPDRAGRPTTFCATHNDYGTPLGYCVSKTTTSACAAPAVFAAGVPRFIGSSASPPKTANVCALPFPE